MKRLVITIEKGPELFEAWAENASGIYGAGNSEKEVKADIIKAIDLYKRHNEEVNIPDILKNDFKIEWHIKT